MRDFVLLRLKNQRGFTLVEILVAMAVMIIVTAAVVPLFVFVSQSLQANKARMTATNLASNAIEQIRTLPFNQVGLKEGNPLGNIPATQQEMVDGVTFTIKTRINWSDDSVGGSCAGSGWPEYKIARVTVTAPGQFSNNMNVSADLHTLVAREGEQPALTGSAIRACVFRGWKVRAEGTDVPVENVRVNITSGPSSPQTVWTISNGAALFFDIDAGDYIVNVDASLLGMMVRPDQAPWEFSIEDGLAAERFEVERPCNLNVKFMTVGGDPIAGFHGQGTLAINQPYGNPILSSFVASDLDGGNLASDFLPGLWPVGSGYVGNYSIDVQIPGHIPSADWGIRDENNNQWDGTFTGPGTTKNITVFFEEHAGGLLYEERNRSDFAAGNLIDVVATDNDRLELAHNPEEEVAQGKPAFGSSYSGNRSYDKAFDGRNRTFWRSGSANMPQWVGCDIESPHNVHKLRVRLGNNHRPKVFELQGSNDMESWDTLVNDEFPESSGNWREYDEFGVVNYRYFRVHVKSIWGDELRIREIELYQPPGYSAGRRATEAIPLSRFSSAPTFSVRWEADEPEETSLEVLAVVTDSLTEPKEDLFLPVDNGGVIPGIAAGDDLSGKYLWILEVLASTDPSRTPSLDRLWVEYNY